MNVKTISVTYERKFNLGDYNGAAIGVSLWADISDDEDENACLADLFTEAKVAVKTQALPLLKERKRIVAQVIEQFAGKPVVQAAPPPAQASNARSLAMMALAEEAELGNDPRDGMPFGDK